MEAKKIRIACIGSREISKDQTVLFQEIGSWIVSKGWYISSGNADGSDYNFACGGNKINPSNVILYLPWASYNSNYIRPGNRVLTEPKEEWFELTKAFHPGWNNLSQGVKRLMARNYGILHRADKVITLLNHNKSGGGGTGQGWRIAEHLKIPRLDLNNKNLLDVKTFLH